MGRLLKEVSRLQDRMAKIEDGFLSTVQHDLNTKIVKLSSEIREIHQEIWI